MWQTQPPPRGRKPIRVAGVPLSLVLREASTAVAREEALAARTVLEVAQEALELLGAERTLAVYREVLGAA